MDAQIVYRPIRTSDNTALAKIIRDIFEEYNVPETGTAYADPEIDDMHGVFSTPGAKYWVVYEGDRLLGGAGIAALKGGPQKVCELQKMYVIREARAKGIGRQLLRLCLDHAKKMGYTQCYLETMSNMHKAQAMYEKAGFAYLEERLGDTGHFGCPVWMIKEL